MRFRDLELDRFQVEAIEHLDKGSSVVVSAATGTGKTIIADYVIDKSLQEGKKVFYTAPIKALSNQKYAEFKAIYGEGHVGILTGDVVHNPDAPLVIMTTEIYRNMLLAKDPVVDDLAAVVFDEIHYLGDAERGTVWEECIIFSPPGVRFVCLSATIPNAKQFANWIESIQHHTVAVVTERKRAVPLEHLFFDAYFGLSSLAEIRSRKRERSYPRYEDAFGGGRGRGGNRRGDMRRLRHQQQSSANPNAAMRAPGRNDDHSGGRSGERGDGRRGERRDGRGGGQSGEAQGPRKLSHLDLIRQLRESDRLSCIYFCFSRANTEKKAQELGQRTAFLDKAAEQEVRAFIAAKLSTTDPSIARLDTTKALSHCLSRGIGFHHAGLLPILKETVEQLFAMGRIAVLYATETFAVGINLPARTVCFDALEKYDGTRFRYLTSTEYFQLAGRAGRRGMDKVGYAISMVDPEFADLEQIERVLTEDKEPLQSQYQLSYNTILSLISNHTPQERRIILLSSFYTYQRAGEHREKMLMTYDKKVQRLRELGYLEDDGIVPAAPGAGRGPLERRGQQGRQGQQVRQAPQELRLTLRGEFAKRIYNHELVITELFTSTLAHELSTLQIALLCATLEYEEKRLVTFKRAETPATSELLRLFKPHRELFAWLKESHATKLEPMLAAWMGGGTFEQITQLTTMPEGDIVRFLRRILDVLQQVLHAVTQVSPDDTELRDRLFSCIAAIDRGIVQVKL